MVPRGRAGGRSARAPSGEERQAQSWSGRLPVSSGPPDPPGAPLVEAACPCPASH